MSEVVVAIAYVWCWIIVKKCGCLEPEALELHDYERRKTLIAVAAASQLNCSRFPPLVPRLSPELDC